MDTEATIRAAVEAYSTGDEAGLDALLSDDLRYRINAQPEIGPFCADCDCKAGFYEAVGQILKDWEIGHYRITDLIVSGDRGAAQIAHTATCRATGRQMDARIALFLTVKGGKLTEIHEYQDTAALMAGPVAAV